MTDLTDEAAGARSLKRDPALIPLSRDHHFALMHALALRRVADFGTRSTTGPVATAENFLTYYEEELLGHMADEEEALLPAVEAPETFRTLTLWRLTMRW